MPTYVCCSRTAKTYPGVEVGTRSNPLLLKVGTKYLGNPLFCRNA